MIRNYVLIAVRHLTKRKLFSFINILCLAIGITFTMLIGDYVMQERNVSADIRNISNQYFMKSNWKVKDMGLDITTIGLLPKTIKEEYPNLVANYYRYNPVMNVISAGDRYFNENVAIGDTTLVSMYGFPVLYGNKENAFINNNSAVITESVAIKLFGRKDVINEKIKLNSTVQGVTQDYLVSAVLKDIHPNAITGLIGVAYDIFVPTKGNQYYQGGDPSETWNSANEIGMIELKPGIKPKDLQEPLKKTIAKYAPENFRDNLTVELVSMKDYHLKNNNGAVEKMLITLSLIAGFILLMGIVNFVNISIGTSSYRIKEIGLRKVFGSDRTQLIFQYITESVLLTSISGLISIGLYEVLRPLFNQILATNLEPLANFNFSKFLWLLIVVLLVGIIAGLYPAFILSASKTIPSVKGKSETVKGGLILRRSLLVLQFSLAIIVFISALTVSRQVSYIFTKDLGYSKEQVLVATAYPKQWDSAGVLKMESIKQELLKISAVKSATLAFEVPERRPMALIDLLPPGSKDNQAINVGFNITDEDYAETMGLHLLVGTYLNHGIGPHVADQIVLNETAMKTMGLTLANAVGSQIKSPANKFTATVTGVVKDFHYSNMQNAIEPVAFAHVKDANTYRFLSLKLNTTDISTAIDQIREAWKNASPNTPFEYSFMDERFQSLYKAELQLKRAANTATILTIIIVMLGIFGVVAFTITKRYREMAVRKVLGAG
ncbi:MAG: hypothetical protein C5B52_08955, partial [Bacteroidetes bacterium]